jgi:hypothetical protein
MTTTELRCPENLSKLLLKLKLAGETPKVSDGNLLEIACRDCRDFYRETDPGTKLVLHYFDFAGRFVETVIK